ncbi:MAG: glycerol-3-phosphate 1-O-acyltransferase PlsY [Candidatus Palauibacterales bacterium]|nr:glycerol-3-phosphate 1-O-acyltransferase PlsY [Candidatus Palauibacterales bacterium]
MRELSFLIAAYLIGSIPSSFLAGRAVGVDVSARGSGNLGATNVLRVVGPWWASAVLLVDALKGFLPVWFFPLWDGSAMPGLAVAYGAATVAGHVWSVFLRFRGGKGVATGGGALLGVAPLTALVTVLVWVGLVLITRTASVASLVAATSAPLVAAWFDASWSAVGFAALMAALVWWTHRDNIRRMRRGDEHRFGAASADAGNGEGAG